MAFFDLANLLMTGAMNPQQFAAMAASKGVEPPDPQALQAAVSGGGQQPPNMASILDPQQTAMQATQPGGLGSLRPPVPTIPGAPPMPTQAQQPVTTPPPVLPPSQAITPAQPPQPGSLNTLVPPQNAVTQPGVEVLDPVAPPSSLTPVSPQSSATPVPSVPALGAVAPLAPMVGVPASPGVAGVSPPAGQTFGSRGLSALQGVKPPPQPQFQEAPSAGVPRTGGFTPSQALLSLLMQSQPKANTLPSLVTYLR